MKVFLTGATGFLGSHIRSVLEEKGIEYLALSRAQHADDHFIQGDLLDPSSYEKALSSCTMIIHAAGEVAHDEASANQMWNIHVRGTKSLLKALKNNESISRLIFLSTSGTIAVSEDSDFLGTELEPPPFALIKKWPYYRAKLFSEQMVFDELPSRISLICINPSLLLGPEDHKGDSLKPIHLFLDGQIPLSPSGGLSFTDVRDVALTVVDALSRGVDRNKYLLGGCNIRFHEFYQKLSRISGVSAPLAPLPKQTHKVLGWFPKWKNIGESLGIDLKREDLILAGHYWYVDSSRAIAELGWSPRDPLRTLEDSVHFLQQESFVDFL
jgi:dihydroflavonol-4-reductase